MPQTTLPITGSGRGTFNLGFRNTTTSDFFRMNMMACEEMVPGDTFKVNMRNFITCAPNAAPINGKVIVTNSAFFVPTRILWDGFQNYIAGISNDTVPYMNLGSWSSSNPNLNIQRLLAMYGINPLVRFDKPAPQGDFKVSALPMRAYQRIWWDYYRDPMVVPDNQVSSYLWKSSGQVSAGELVTFLNDFRYRCYARNYFTTALRSPNGDSVTNAAVRSLSNASMPSVVGSNSRGAGPGYVSGNDLGNYAEVNPEDGSITSTDIQTLRASNAIQRWIEKTNILGGRLKDRLLGMFGKTPSSAVLNMSEYLGSDSFDMNFEVSSASASDGQPSSVNAFGSTEPSKNVMRGQLSGNGTSTENSFDVAYSANEHGYFVIIQTIMPEPIYYQGIDRKFLRGVNTPNKSRFDFFCPEMEGLGYQPMYLCEVCGMPNIDTFDKGNYDPFGVFGYQERYADYKCAPHNKLGGDFVTRNASLSMQNWHLGRDLLREFGITNAQGAPISGKTGSDIINNITRDTISAGSSAARAMYDDKFVISSDSFDHFVIDAKIDISAFRPMTDDALPTIDKVVDVKRSEVGGVRF